MFVFQKSWRALISCDTRFEIRPTVLLPTNYKVLKTNISEVQNYKVQMMPRAWKI